MSAGELTESPADRPLAIALGPVAGCRTAAVGTAWSSCRVAALVTGARPERHRPSCQERNASVTMNAPTPRPHATIRVPTVDPEKERKKLCGRHDSEMTRGGQIARVSKM